MDRSLIREQIRTVLINEVAPMFDGQPLEVQRAVLDTIGAQSEMPMGVLVRRTSVAGVPVEWLLPTNTANRVLLYVHGGGFTMGSCDSHRALAARVGIACRARVLLPEYRLAPEHPFPAGLEDMIAVYTWLLEVGYRSDQIIIAGDSAGGGLAMSTVLLARDRGLPLPNAVVMLSPWTDLTLTGKSMVTRADVDPWLKPGMFPPLRDGYLADADPSSPLASPLQADMTGLPPMLIQVGDHEILLSDAERLAIRARAAGVHVELEVAEALWHVWHLMAPALPDANEALARISVFVESLYGHGVTAEHGNGKTRRAC